MYHYVQSEPGLWTVGTGTPKSQDGNDWIPESDHATPEAAAARVHYLNGGNDEQEIARLVECIGNYKKVIATLGKGVGSIAADAEFFGLWNDTEIEASNILAKYKRQK